MYRHRTAHYAQANCTENSPTAEPAAQPTPPSRPPLTPLANGRPSPALAAAYNVARARLQLETNRFTPSRASTANSTVRQTAARASSSKSSVGRHLRTLKTTSLPAFSSGPKGRPTTLTKAEEEAITA